MGPVPVLAVVGRPNVGKSTLVNRIIGRREAVVEDVPGVTRDRVSDDADWSGRAFTVVDTGGWDPDARDSPRRSGRRPRSPSIWPTRCSSSSTRRSASPTHDEAVVKILRASGKPVMLAANKVDDQRTEAEAFGLWNLGLGEPWPVSALHGRGSATCSTRCWPPCLRRPRRASRRSAVRAGSRSSASRTSASRRCSTGSPGRNASSSTGRRHHRRPGRRADRARRPDLALHRHRGIRKRVKEASGHEYYASLRTSTAIDRAEVAVLVVDGGQSLSEQDMRILQTVREAGRALVIAFNKWDLVDEERRYYLEREIERELVQVQWAPRIEHHRAHRLARRPAGPGAGEGDRRLGDPHLDRCPQRLPGPPRRRAPAPGAQRQAAPDHVRHPGVDRAADVRALHERQMDASYERFIERRLREEFGFVGTPIVLTQRPREKRKR